MKINYIIGTWNGVRLNNRLNLSYYENVLKNHIKILSNVQNNISQITIMRPKSNIKNSYYDIELNDKIKIVDCENQYQSYGQWLKALELFSDDFDYHILIEDDYVPGIDNFDTKLIEIYMEGSYLCSMVSPHGCGWSICAISNGIISKKTIENVIKNNNYVQWLDDFAKKYSRWVFGHNNYQIAFSRYFVENNIIINDYSTEYMIDFHEKGKIIDYSKPDVKNKEKIFTAIQTII
jgi:hypothetical protein